MAKPEIIVVLGVSRCIISILLLGMSFSTGFSCPLLHVLPADGPASCPSRLTLTIVEGCIFSTVLLAMVEGGQEFSQTSYVSEPFLSRDRLLCEMTCNFMQVLRCTPLK